MQFNGIELRVQNKPLHLLSIDSTKVSRQFNSERIVFSTNVGGTVESHIQKNEFGFLPINRLRN